MKTNNSSIQLNETFVRLASGAAALGDVICERMAARTERIASENKFARLRRERAELADPFTVNFYH